MRLGNFPAPTRPKERREYLYNFVYEAKMRYLSESQIKSLLSSRNIVVSTGTIRGLIKQVDEQMKLDRSLATEKRLDRELAYLEHIRKLALEGFDDSKNPTRKDDNSIETNPVLNTDAGGQLLPQGHEPAPIEQLMGLGNRQQVGKQIQRTITETHAGDPKYLTVALSASKEIRTLLGIDPEQVKRIEIGIRTEHSHTPEQLAQLGRAELAREFEKALEDSALSE